MFDIWCVAFLDNGFTWLAENAVLHAMLIVGMQPCDYADCGYAALWLCWLWCVCCCRPPPLCGAVAADNSYVVKPGDKVAARVKSSDGEENWILAEVVTFNSASNKYEVDDIDAEEGKE